MSELVALARLAIIQYRWALAVLIGAAVLGQLVAVSLFVAGAGQSENSLAASALVLALLPAGLAGIILFDFAHGGDLASPASGCSHWLLRMPLAAWKIAIVPVILKTTWITASWLLVALGMRVLVDLRLPLLAPCLGFSAAAVWLMVIAWLPLQVGWYRLLLLSVLFVLLYLLLGLIFGGPHIQAVQWRPLARIAGLSLSGALYIAAVSAAIRTVAIARTAPQGITRERGRSLSFPGVASGAREARPFASPLHALAWHEFARTQHWAMRTLAFGVLPACLIFGLLVPLHPAAVIGVLILFTYLAGFSVCGNREVPTLADGSTLPTYLSASPLTTAQIAWTRLVVALGIVTGVFACVGWVFALGAVWPSNRLTWLHWAAEQAAALPGSPGVMVTGARLSLAILLGSATFLIGRIVAYWWIGLSGRNWFMILMTLPTVSIFLVLLAFFLRWFSAQSQWSEVQATMQNVLTWVPHLIAGALVLKAAAVSSVAVALRRAQLVSRKTIGTVTFIWLALVLVIGSSLGLLVPYPRATIMLSVALTSLAVPLARILAMPLSLDWNRHR